MAFKKEKKNKYSIADWKELDIDTKKRIFMSKYQCRWQIKEKRCGMVSGSESRLCSWHDFLVAGSSKESYSVFEGWLNDIKYTYPYGPSTSAIWNLDTEIVWRILHGDMNETEIGREIIDYMTENNFLKKSNSEVEKTGNLDFSETSQKILEAIEKDIEPPF